MPKPAKKAQTKIADPLLEAAVEHFAGRSHDAWRRTLLRTNPEQKDKPRMRLRGGIMVDVNQPWAKLHPKAKADNLHAARDAYAAVRKNPNDREAAADAVHKSWIKRNKHDKSLDQNLFKPYAQLSEVEKDKDRAHVDRMKAAIEAVSAQAKPRKPQSAFKTVRVDAKSWARLEAAAARLSQLTGRPVAPDALLAAGVEAILAVSGAMAATPKKRRG